MAATIFKTGGLAAVLAGGAFALLQADAGVRGTLAAAQPAGPQWPGFDADDGAGDGFGSADPEPPANAGAAADDGLFFPEANWETNPTAPPANVAADTPAWGADADFGFDPQPAAGPVADPAVSPAAAQEPPDPFGDWGNDPSAEDLGDASNMTNDFGDAETPAWDDPPAAAPAAVAPTDAPPNAAANLTVRKDAPATVAPGEAFVYTITVANRGGEPAGGVLVEEAIPAGVRLEGTNPRADLTGDTLRWALPAISAGEERVLSVRVTPTGSGVVGGVTVVRTELAVAARTRIPAPALSLTVAADGEARAGRAFDLNLTVANGGDADAAGVSVRTLLPDGVAHASGERDLQYDVGPLPAGQSRVVTLTLAADTPGEVAFDCELTAANAAAAAASAAVRVRDRQLTLTRRGPRTRFVGRPGTFVNTVRNASAERSAPATVTEVVPARFSFESSDAGRFDPADRTVTWAVPALEPGGSADLSVTLVADAAGEAETRVALLAGGRVESELAAVTAVRGFTSLAPRVRGLHGPLAVGERVAVRVTLENTGTDAAAGVVATVALPPCVAPEFVGGNLDAEETADGLRFTLPGRLAPGETPWAEVILEGVSKGSGAVRLTVNADDLPAPIRREEPVSVYADAAE